MAGPLRTPTARAFALAPMDRQLRVMTYVCSLVPLALLGAALVSPVPVETVLFGSFGFVMTLYAGVWFALRPSRFEVDEQSLRIVWPARFRVVPISSITAVERIGVAEFRRIYGYGMRIGAGGLWGGFGLLKTGRDTFSMWISRTDELVIVRLRDARPLLITPEDPSAFVAALQRAAD